MEYKYFAAKLLPRQSWKWLWANDKKSPTEKHRIFISLQTTEPPSGSLKELVELFNNILQEEGDFYDDIFIEEVSFHRGCGDYDHEWHIAGSRLETDTEFQARLNHQQELAQKEQKDLADKEKQKEAKEYEQFLKLQAKFKKE